MAKKMEAAIRQISLDRATFENTGTTVVPTYINFFFGRNGAGKSTLAEVIAADEGIVWRDGDSHAGYDVLVYNQEFIDRNFGSYGDLAGVITIHEQNIEVQQQLDRKKKEKAGAESVGKQFRKDLDDKIAARDTAIAQFQKMCWSQTAQIREAFKEALKGKLKSQQFMDGVLATPAAVDHDFDELKSLYDIAFSLDSRPYHVFGKIDSASTYGTLPGRELLDKAIVSSSGSSFSQFIKALNATDWVRQGHDHYAAHMPVMRGKIDMPGTIKNKLARKQVLTCEYDELSENNLLNQILKTTVMLLIRHAKVDAEYKSDLKKEMLFFSEVDTIEPASVKWKTIRFQRSNQSYRMLISLCQFILEGMLLTTDQGEYKMASFVDEQRMCRLYEKFILEYFSKHYPTLEVRASQIPWALDDGIGTMLPVMQSDITLSSGNKVLIIDAKYYAHTTQVQYDKHTLHSNNLYQIFTYVKNKDSEFGDKPHEVSGVLLYAQTDEAIQPDNTYMMSGNRISVKTLDLNCDFPVIAAQLNAIADIFMQ